MRSLALLLGLAAATSLSASELRLTVADPLGSPIEASGVLEALPGAPPRSPVTFSTGLGGRFRLADLPPGPYKLTLTKPGFQSIEATLEVEADAVVERAFTLEVEPMSGSVIVRALPASLDGVPGSTDELTKRELDTFRPFTVKEAVRRIAGVHVVDEDAFGLNLNIGIRGQDPRRTQRTMLLEDGAPIHLAPYGDPSAHYHPPPETIEGVEVMKGSGQILHGPQTVGGMLNFITEPVPAKFRAGFGAVVGNRDFRSFDGKLGGVAGRVGLLGNFVHREGAGVREHHAHKVTLARLKAQIRLDPRQTLMLKGGYYEENSRTGEGGLGQAEFDANPLANPFRDDRFFLDRTQLQGVHTVELNDSVRLVTNAYYQRIQRTSYRQIDNWGDQMTAVAATGCTGGARLDYFNTASLCGNKMRPRNYEFFGVEPRLDWRGRLFGMRNEGVAGFRVHSEWIERRRFNGFSPDARETDPDVFFRDWNKIRVNAFPVFAQTTLQTGSWTFTPGLRVETIRLHNQALRRGNTPVDVELDDNRTVFLPGFGATYTAIPRATVFAGIHRGFAPTRPDENFEPTDPNFTPVTPERSTNAEFGIRTIPNRFVRLEAALFRTDFRNQIVRGATVGLPQFTWVNAGRTLNEGFEAKANLELDSLLPAGHGLLFTTAYTRLFTAKFNSDRIEDGVNILGNRLPYAPRNLVTPSVAYRHRAGWSLSFSAESVGEQMTDSLNERELSAGGSTGAIAAFTTYHAALNAPLGSSGFLLFVSGTNLADRRYIVSRVDGIHVGRPRQVVAGIRYER